MDFQSLCPGCHISLPLSLYPADNRYGVSSAECRQCFDEILVKEGELFGYPAAHRLIIDAYCIQHPPRADIQKELGINQRFMDASVQSIGIHLIALYLAFEHKIELRKIPLYMDTILSNMAQRNESFKELQAPLLLGDIRAKDVRDILYSKTNITLQEYEALAQQWARSAWDAWKQHHKIVHDWYRIYYQ